MDDVFDVEKLRRNWARANPQQAQEISPALADVDSTRDLRRELTETFARIQTHALERFPAEREAIEALLAEIRMASVYLQSVMDQGPNEGDNDTPEDVKQDTDANEDGDIEADHGIFNEDNEGVPSGSENVTANDEQTETESPKEASANRHATHLAIDAFEELLEAFTLVQSLTR